MKDKCIISDKEPPECSSFERTHVLKCEDINDLLNTEKCDNVKNSDSEPEVYLSDDENYSNNRLYSDSDEQDEDSQIDATKYVVEVEEEMWDDDSDDYWDPSVRDIPWSFKSNTNPNNNITSIEFPIVEGQFDDLTDDESS